MEIGTAFAAQEPDAAHPDVLIADESELSHATVKAPDTMEATPFTSPRSSADTLTWITEPMKPLKPRTEEGCSNVGVSFHATHAVGTACSARVGNDGGN